MRISSRTPLLVLATATTFLALGGAASADFYCRTHPAICISICGTNPCKDKKAEADVQQLELINAPAARPTRVGATGGAAGGASVKSVRSTYTCSNPAICIAVCGKATCP